MNERTAKAADVLGPFGDGTNATNVRAYTISATAYAAEVPEDWWDCFVTMKAIGADAYWFFSEQNSVLPDSSKASSASGGADAQLGWRLRDGEVEEMLVPSPSPGNRRGPLYICIDGSGTGVLWMRKASKK